MGLIDGCDLLVRSTLADGDAISVREALALGRRVVASDVAPRPPGVCLHRAGDPTDLARALADALTAPPPSPFRVDGAKGLLDLYQHLSGEPPCAESRAG